MAEIQGGVPVTGFVSPTDSADTFATHKDFYGQGGYRSVANIAERDAITTDRRSEGMIVFINETKVAYQLIGGITNDDWQVTNDVALGSLQENFIIMGNPDNEPQASPALLDVEEDIGIIYDRLDQLDGGTTGGGSTNGTRNLGGFVVGEVEPDGSMYTFRGPDCYLSEIPTGGDVNFFNSRLIGLGDPYPAELGEQDATNRRYVDNKTWTSLQITDFDTAVTSHTLDEFAPPGADLDINGKLLTNVATPLSTDTSAAATVEYVDDAIAAVSGGGVTKLTGAVTGTAVGDTIDTTLTPITTSQITNYTSATQALINATPISSLAAANANINLGTFSISSSATPTTGNNLGNKTYIDSTSSSAATTAVNNRTTTLTGAVTGTGTGNTINTILTNITPSQVTGFDAQVRTNRLDQMALPTANMNFNGKLLNNIATPLSTNTNAAATVEYVDDAIAAAGGGGGGPTTLTGAVTGSGIGTINTILTPITTSQITDFGTGTQSLINATPLNNLAWPTGPIQMNGKQLENIGTALGPTDAVQRVYVDNQISMISSFLSKPYGGLKIVGNGGLESLGTTPAPITTTQNLITTVYNFDSPSNGRLRCLSSTSYTYQLIATIQLTAIAPGTRITMQIVKNGVVGSALPSFAVYSSQVNFYVPLTVAPEPILLALNDYVQLYASVSTATGIQIANMTLIASVIS
jgi:hypothetical protein